MSAKSVREFAGKRVLHSALLHAPLPTNVRLPLNASSQSAYTVPPTMRMAAVSITLPPAVSASSSSSTSPEEYTRLLAAEVQRALAAAEQQHASWLTGPNAPKLVVKVDMLVKRRGKLGLIGVNVDWAGARRWIEEHAGKACKVEHATGVLTHFLVEPFVPHQQQHEHYICIQATRSGDVIYYSTRGGVDVGNVEEHASQLAVPVKPRTSASSSGGAAAAAHSEDEDTAREASEIKLLKDAKDNYEFPLDDLLRMLDTALGNNASPAKRDALAEFIVRLYAAFVDAQFTYLEINPLVVVDGEGAQQQPQIYLLDLAGKLDQTAEFECGVKWSRALAQTPEYQQGASGAVKTVGDIAGPPMEFPAPFGRQMTKEEAYIAELDAKTGASLKLTVLNPHGRIWTMVAGGGASVVYSDAIAAYGYADELANYGEYSGAPSETQSYEYAKTILDLMTRGQINPKGKILFIGGGIANFTNVAATFKGIARALKDFQKLLNAHGVRIFVRRAGPNWQEGLKLIRQLGASLGIEMQVFGPETHITAIVPLALTGKMSSFGDVMPPAYDPFGLNSTVSPTAAAPANGSIKGDDKQQRPTNGQQPAHKRVHQTQQPETKVTVGPKGTVHFPQSATTPHAPAYQPFTGATRAFIYGMQPRAVQGMLDFDYICRRAVPSVAAMIYPFGGAHVQKFYWGTQETLVPVYQSLAQAVAKHPDVDTVVNFASCRSVYETTMEVLVRYSQQLRTVAIIAEGVPERRARQLLAVAKEKGVLIIGPATVGGIKPGCFKIGNTGGMMDNIVSSKLYRPGSVAYVSKSGGMSNELNNIISRTTNGVYEGVAIGGDRYPGSTFIDHLFRFEQDPQVKMMVLLGEVGGVEEYEIAKAVRDGRITKPVVAWCIGTCATMFATEVQFGHAGAMANSDSETAAAKNRALKDAGVIVPDTFEELPRVLNETYGKLVGSGVIVPEPEPEVPKIPIDYSWAQELGLIRKPASFVSTICDDRGQELLYAGMPISDVFKQNIGIGGVVSLLWFKRRLPEYACKFIEMVLMLTADHGPAVSGAHNTIVTARAGKDLVSSICAGLLTIGERFGGALDGAADQFSVAYDKNLTPREFVDSMRRQNKLILGIGHKIKSRTNPDLRVEILKQYATSSFPATPILDYALAVENITTSKKDNLILNVDGAIGVLFVDLLRHSGAFTRDEADQILKIGTLNGLFVLGRSIGFIGHFLDQKRLKQGLYRHPWDDISYLVGQDETARILASASGN
ncbi:ATP citrate lyase subunit 1 [Sorochytrium milnesiophthora]